MNRAVLVREWAIEAIIEFPTEAESNAYIEGYGAAVNDYGGGLHEFWVTRATLEHWVQELRSRPELVEKIREELESP